ncbi:hypothetical protein ACIRH0_03890 [Streptomyces sp. NPDC093675]|uniref:hypothetical protein n=1 Tax=Streptomyces sp. NPDC093675 TaxID=3366049 RepID=UPI0038155528
MRPVWLADGTQVCYDGSLEELHGGIFRVRECDRYDCEWYELLPVSSWWAAAQHVRPQSVTALAA